MSNESDSFIQEVDEQVRADRMMSWLRKYGPWLGGLLVLVLVGAFGWETWRGLQANDARKQSDLFAAAQKQLQDSDAAAAATAFQALSTTGPDNYRVMALMEHAAALEAQGDLQAALAGFDAAATAAKDPLMRDTARLRAAYLVADTQDFQAVQTRLQPLIAEHNQISYLARELLAVEAWKAGQLQVARDTLQAISLAFDAPQSVRQRAELELSVIGPGDQPASAPAPAHTNTPSPGETK